MVVCSALMIRIFVPGSYHEDFLAFSDKLVTETPG